MSSSCFICKRISENARACPNCLSGYCEDCFAYYSLKVADEAFECVRCALLNSSPLNLVVKELTPPTLERSPPQGRSALPLALGAFDPFEFDGVEVRCIKLDSRGAAIFGEQTWPDNFRLACPGSGYVLTEGASLKPSLSLKKRKDNCYAVSAATFSKIAEKNLSAANRRIVLEYDNVYDGRNSLPRDAGRIHYALCVVGVKRLRFEELLASSLVRELAAEDSLAYFKRLLSSQGEEVAVAGLRLDILCRITFTRPQHPVRGNNCQHLSCFSLKSFYLSLGMSEHRKVYCPICQRTLQFYLLDAAIDRIIQQAPADVDSVVINSLGEFNLRTKAELPAKRLPVMEVSESDEERSREARNDQQLLSALEDPSYFTEFIDSVCFQLAMFCYKEEFAADIRAKAAALLLDDPPPR